MSAPKEKGWREELRDLYLIKSPDDNGLITDSVTTSYGVFKASRPNLAFYLTTQDAIEEFIERTLSQQKREIVEALPQELEYEEPSWFQYAEKHHSVYLAPDEVQGYNKAIQDFRKAIDEI